MGGVRCTVLAVVLLTWAAASGWAPGAVTAPEEGPDIKGPLGPMGYPGAVHKHWARRVGEGALAVAFAGVALGLRRRRRRRAARGRPEGPGLAPVPLEADAGALPPDLFYERLLRAARSGLARRLGPGAAALTPRELGEAQICADPEAGDLQRRWRELCARAEAAQYGAAPIEPAPMRADLRLFDEVLRAADAAANEGD